MNPYAPIPLIELFDRALNGDWSNMPDSDEDTKPEDKQTSASDTQEHTE